MLTCKNGLWVRAASCDSLDHWCTRSSTLSSGHGYPGDRARPTKARGGQVGFGRPRRTLSGKCLVGVLGRSGVVGLIERKES